MDAIRVRVARTRFESVVREAPGATMLRERLNSPATAARVLQLLTDGSPVEQFWVLMLDAKHRLLGCELVSQGTLTTSLVHPREVFGPAIRLPCAAIIVGHNHPSGDPEPSMEDVSVTKRLHAAGILLGIPLLDHVIVANDGERATSVSLQSRNPLGG